MLATCPEGRRPLLAMSTEGGSFFYFGASDARKSGQPAIFGGACASQFVQPFQRTRNIVVASPPRTRGTASWSCGAEEFVTARHASSGAADNGASSSGLTLLRQRFGLRRYAPKGQVNRRQQEEVQNRRRGQAPQDHGRHRVFDFMPWLVAGQSPAAPAPARYTVPSSESAPIARAAPRKTSDTPNGSFSSCSRCR